MAKMKTHSGAAKRFKKKKNGSIKRGKAFRSHILTKKDNNTKRKNRKGGLVSKADLKKVKEMI